MCLMKWDSANRRALTDANEQQWACDDDAGGMCRSKAGFTVAHEREGETVIHLICIIVSISRHVHKAISALLAPGPAAAKWVS